jgi:hypothetical protein
MKHAANSSAWAIGQQRRNGFRIRRVVWGLVMAWEEKRDDEEIRAASISVERQFKRRRDLRIRAGKFSPRKEAQCQSERMIP